MCEYCRPVQPRSNNYLMFSELLSNSGQARTRKLIYQLSKRMCVCVRMRARIRHRVLLLMR